MPRTLHASPIGPFALAVFDWDGTVVDTTAAISKSIQHACGKLGLPVPADAVARSVIGLGWREAISIVAPDCRPDQWEAFSAAYVERYRALEGRVAVFPGLEALLKNLRTAGVTLAVATGKSRRGLDRMLELTGLGRYFATTQTADENPSKPHPGMLEQIGIETGIPREETVMIGDTTHDLQMAANYGCRGVAVATGAMRWEELSAFRPLAAAAGGHAVLARLLGAPIAIEPASAEEARELIVNGA